MTTLITGERLRDAVQNQTFIQNGDLSGVEGVKYDFRMSSRILKASYGQAIDIDKLPENERSGVGVDPGEAVFVLTKEKLCLPGNMVATLSPKRKIAHGGVIVLGGFSIDPNYCGCLWVGLYNFSSNKYLLKPGKKLIAAMFYELEGNEEQQFPVPDAVEETDFPDELVNLIKNYKPLEIKSITDALEQTRKRLDDLTTEVRDDKSWKKEFKDSQERQTIQIDKIIEGLKEEREARKLEDASIRNKIDRISNIFGNLKAAWVVVALIVGALLQYAIPKVYETFFNPPTAVSLSSPAPVSINPQPSQVAPQQPVGTQEKMQR